MSSGAENMRKRGDAFRDRHWNAWAETLSAADIANWKQWAVSSDRELGELNLKEVQEAWDAIERLQAREQAQEQAEEELIMGELR